VVRVLRQRRHDDELATDVVSVYGYRAECGCGWQGKRRHAWWTARQDGGEHLESGDCNRTGGGND
jgi:hypothetical protein